MNCQCFDQEQVSTRLAKSKLKGGENGIQRPCPGRCAGTESISSLQRSVLHAACHQRCFSPGQKRKTRSLCESFHLFIGEVPRQPERPTSALGFNRAGKTLPCPRLPMLNWGLDSGDYVLGWLRNGISV